MKQDRDFFSPWLMTRRVASKPLYFFVGPLKWAGRELECLRAWTPYPCDDPPLNMTHTGLKTGMKASCVHGEESKPHGKAAAFTKNGR